jgi:Glycosyl hydrolase family 115/Gylcosyl hydrolase family 115 C-terminal domain
MPSKNPMRPCAIFSVLLFSLLTAASSFSQSISDNHDASYVSIQKRNGYFTLSSSGISAPIYISGKDFQGVIRAARDLQSDINRVTNAEPSIVFDSVSLRSQEKFLGTEIVIVGTLGMDPMIDSLVAHKKIDASLIAGQWEAYLIQTIQKPMPGVERALVIAGSDKRGTIYGIYDLSAHIGVSPWYWWADVPVRHESKLYIRSPLLLHDKPAVKYRGIFINDEAPALSGWAREKFGGFNSKFYQHVFELILRLRGNYLWPAMWGSAFDVDDTLNPILANEYGIVMGTSHAEPMMRANDEWRRFGTGPWNYQTNDSVLRNFWREGIKRMDSYESIVTIGMRGNGDMPMSREANVSLLEKIVQDQRNIIADVTGKNPADVPQDWALYKEVQEYYEKGMRVPDDVTLLLCDDNWGNIRMLPKLGDTLRSGGYGIYYHFDYVGGPRNYKWLNTNQIERTWEQMHLAYNYGVKRIWIVNVGDIKPMELPISFFLDYAWDPDQWPAARLPDYYIEWARQQFGNDHSKEIAEILAAYTRYNSRRKPELLSPDTYSLENYREAETVVADYAAVAKKAQQIYNDLPVNYKPAFYQLVLYPVLACSNLNDLYVTVAKNRLYALQGRAVTNSLAQRAEELFAKDSSLSYYYNHTMEDGRWDHMMDQTHIGYTYWQEPPKNVMPEVKYIEVPAVASMGIAIEGSDRWWPQNSSNIILPPFDPYNKQSYYIEIFNRGKNPFHYSITTKSSWLHVQPSEGKIETEKRLWVSVDWKKIPTGQLRIPIEITGPNKSISTVSAVINNPSFPKPNQVRGFVEGDGYVSIEAEHYSRAVAQPPFSWLVIPNLGRTLSAITIMPVTASPFTPGGNSPHLEYPMYLFDKGDVTVKAYISPTLNFHDTIGLRYGISFDNQPPQIITINADNSNQTWEKWVSNNINMTISHHVLDSPGEHVLKFWAVDPAVVLQKLVVDCGGVKSSYLGPPESFYRNLKETSQH